MNTRSLEETWESLCIVLQHQLNKVLWSKYAVTYLALSERILTEEQMVLSCYYIKSGICVTACNLCCHF